MTADAPAADEVNFLIGQLPTGPTATPIDVPISYEIIELFSEGLYQSPQKAVEELVSNSFDAGALNVRVVLPQGAADDALREQSLYVVDDGSGMDLTGFRALWRVANSAKRSDGNRNGRKQIGQFGIGKLAAFVLAWRLTHVSKVDGEIRVVSMNFHDVTGSHQYDPNAAPITLQLHSLGEEDAKALLGELEDRDPGAWALLFGSAAERSENWTVAALSEFKDLFSKLSAGTLSWVLRTGLPLSSNFNITLDGDHLEPARLNETPLFESEVGGPKDAAAKNLDLLGADGKVRIPGIDGEITGTSLLFEKMLTRGKAESAGRSHGFFVRVRGRIINLDDELFGLSALSHGAWARFNFVIDVDGLNQYLLSSREGVKEVEPVRTLRKYLLEKFNEARNVWTKREEAKLKELALRLVKGDIVRQRVGEPLAQAARALDESNTRDSYYLDLRGSDGSPAAEEPSEQPFQTTRARDLSALGPVVTYDVADRSLGWNQKHPLMARIRSHSKNDDPVELVAAGEVMLEAIMLSEGVAPGLAEYILRQRDRAMRVLVGSGAPTASMVLSELEYAHEDKDALEHATGRAFEVLGFEYTPMGGNSGGTDGVVHARLGQHADGPADFRIVYDAKSTSGTSVSVQKADFAALADFATTEHARYGFIIAKRFDGQSDELAAINRRKDLMNDLGKEHFKFLILTLDHLRRLVEMHLKFGLPATAVRSLFDDCGSTSEVDAWLHAKTDELGRPDARVPLKALLDALDAQKHTDPSEVINLISVRATSQLLSRFSRERLSAQLSAVAGVLGDKWITVNPTTSDVELHSSSKMIIEEFYRRLEDEGVHDIPQKDDADPSAAAGG